MRCRLFALLLPILLAVPATGRGYEYGTSAHAVGLAGAVRSSAVGPAALQYNPAALARFMMYGIELGYDYVHFDRGHGAHVSVADSKTNEWVALGLSYAFQKADHEGRGSLGHRVRGALASGYRSPTFSGFIGASVHWAQLERKPQPDFEAVTADVGILLDVFQMVRLGVVGHNIVAVDDATEMPISLGLGLSFTYGSLLVSFDTLLDFSTKDEVTPVYSVGVEYFVANLIAVRSGFEHNQVEDDSNRLSFGVGYVSQLWGVDIAYRQSVEDKSDAMFVLNARFFLP